MKKIYTFGCKVNQVESLDVEKLLVGYDTDNLVVINSCSITDRSEQKCRQLINRITKIEPEKQIILTGCYVERAFNDLEKKYPNILLLNNIDKPKLLSKLKLKKIKKQVTERSKTRAFLKIQDGCNNFCSYCIVPYVRPTLWNKPINKIKEEIETFLEQDYKEIVLTGIRVGMYNYKDNKGKDLNLVDVIKLLSTYDKLKRIRISSIDPKEITDELIEVYKDKVMPHIHVPLQSCDNKILEDMGRGYNIKFIEKLLNKLKKKIPNLRITSDIIVGFPTENKTNFRNTYEFLKDSGIDGLHIFPFSKRPGTKACNIKNTISKEELDLRKQNLTKLDIDLRIKSAKKYLNITQEILIESKTKQGYLEGLTPNYIKVNIPFEKNFINTIKTCKFTSIDSTWPVKLIDTQI